MNKCQARQHSDQMVCFKCSSMWDMNDPYPPKCEGIDKPGRLSKYISNLVDPTKQSQNDLWINACLILFTAVALVVNCIFLIVWLTKLFTST